MKTVLTYGTFDLFHVGHVNLLRRLKGLGDRLIVGVSTDEFNREKGKQCLIPYEQRREIVSAIRYVDEVIPESSWEQKVSDIRAYGVAVFAMGEDWQGRFDFLRAECEVIYLRRTEGVSSTEIRVLLKSFDEEKVRQIKEALDLIANVARDLS